MTITVTGLKTVQREPLKDATIIAIFDVDIAGIIELRGCALADSPKRGRIVWTPPCLQKPGDPERAIRLSAEVREMIVAAANSAYDAFVAHRTANDFHLSAAVALVREIEARDAA